MSTIIPATVLDSGRIKENWCRIHSLYVGARVSVNRVDNKGIVPNKTWISRIHDEHVKKRLKALNGYGIQIFLIDSCFVYLVEEF